MDHTIVPFSQLSDQQVHAVARLHHQVLHSLLADLGLPFVERYYQIAQAEPGVIGVCAASEAGGPLGWAVGSSKPEQVNGRLRAAWMWFSLQMLRVVFTRPRVLGQLFASLRTAAAPTPEGAVELTYIGVDKSARGRGLGRALLNAFTQAAREAEYRSVVLSVEADNESAIALYTKAGFQVTASFTEGSYRRHRMELML
jgi:ribosomal protein S18 acetylase RimI-like enzyme